MLLPTLKDMLVHNKFTNQFTFNEITEANQKMRLNSKTSSIGFIYRHIGEIMHMYLTFFGVVPTVVNTTLGYTDEGKEFDLAESHQIVTQAYENYQQLLDNQPESFWTGIVDTPFFGKVSRARIFFHVLTHNAYHAGQITLTLKRGELA